MCYTTSNDRGKNNQRRKEMNEIHVEDRKVKVNGIVQGRPHYNQAAALHAANLLKIRAYPRYEIVDLGDSLPPPKPIINNSIVEVGKQENIALPKEEKKIKAFKTPKTPKVKNVKAPKIPKQKAMKDEKNGNKRGKKVTPVAPAPSKTAADAVASKDIKETCAQIANGNN